MIRVESAANVFNAIVRTLIVLVFLGLSAGLNVRAQDQAQAQVRGVLLMPNGLPAEGYQVGLRNDLGDLFLSAATGQDGTFAIESLPPAAYRLVAFTPDGAEVSVLGRRVELAAGQVERVELRLGEQEFAPGRAPEPRTADAGRSARGGAKTGSRTVKVWITAVATAGAFGLGYLLGDDGDTDQPGPPMSASAP